MRENEKCNASGEKYGLRQLLNPFLLEASEVFNFLLQIVSGATNLIAFIRLMPRSGLPGLKKMHTFKDFETC